VKIYHDSRAPDQERSGIFPRLVGCDGFSGWDLVRWFGFGYDGERDLACVIQGLGKVVCQPLVMWLCDDPRSLSPLMN
jgi:hypothetical protein